MPLEGNTMKMKASTLARSGKSSTNVTSAASLEDTHLSERLYQLAEIIGASKTIPGTLGIWALVVDAAAYDEDFLLERSVTTGWKYFEEGVRGFDVLVAAAVEAIEKYVTDQDMLVDLVQLIQEVFDQLGSPCPPGISVECGMDNGVLS